MAISKKHAAIIGWGKCVPQAVLTNDDLSQILDTSDQWIRERTGIKERRISSVGASELAYVAVARAIDCAGLKPNQIDMIITANCSPDYQVPNISSIILQKLGDVNAAAIDLNSACTGFITSLVTATAMIESGRFQRIVVVGAECMSQIVPWLDRSISVLFGDGAAAVVLEATDEPVGLLADKLNCQSKFADILSFDFSLKPPTNFSPALSHCIFKGKEIFKYAVNGMCQMSNDVIELANLTIEDIDLVIPHQANFRIVDAIRKKFKLANDAVFTNLQHYANTSAASIPLAICEAVEQHRIQPYSTLVLPAFGAGLTCASAVLRWGSRVNAVNNSQIQLVEDKHDALDLVNNLIKKSRQ